MAIVTAPVPRRRKQVKRTVQYWRLVDARDGSLQAEIDWHDVTVRHIYGANPSFLIDGRAHRGTAISIPITTFWSSSFDLRAVTGAPPLPDPTTTYGLVLAV